MMRIAVYITYLMILIEVMGVFPMTENPPMEGIDGIFYKFAKTGQPSTLICKARSEGSADFCKFTR